MLPVAAQGNCSNLHSLSSEDHARQGTLHLRRVLLLDSLSHYCHNHAGTLPPSWGDTGAWPALTTLNLYEVPLYGTLPTAWGGHKSFPALLDFCIGAADNGTWHVGVTQLSGSLPPQWGSNSSFQLLEQLWIANLPPGPGLSGSLPPEWGSPHAWQNLQQLNIANTQGGISGTTLTGDHYTYFLTAAGVIAVQSHRVHLARLLF